MSYGSTIKQAREDRRLTQEQLAEALDVTRQAVSKWEADLSRPARSKLERLSEILEVPPETWAALDAELAAASLPPDRSRPWRILSALLGAACLLLAAVLALVLWRNAHPSTLVPSEEAVADGGDPGRVLSLSEVFPDTLPLSASHDFDFGDAPVGGPFEPSLVPFLDDPLEIQEQEIWSGCLENPEDPRRSLSLSVVKVNPVHDGGVTFHDVYLLTALPDEKGNLQWQIFTLLAGGNHYVNQEGGFWAERFANVLGYDGWKLSILIGASAGDLDYYIIQRPDGSPALLTTSCKAQEADIDDDGVLEILSIEGSPWRCEIVDTAPEVEGAFRYTLDSSDDAYVWLGLHFEPEAGGFVATDSQGSVLARYLLRDGEMARVPLTAYSALDDYPDAAGTRIHFVTHDGDGLADGREPDSVFICGSGSRITHRQQAYLALQELYTLTGLKIDECYCAANEYGVLFSALPDGFNQRSFFTLDFSEEYGGAGIPGFRIAWRELGNEWSPLSLAEAALPEGVPGEQLLSRYYDRLRILRTGEIARETGGEFPGERNLYLEDGSLFVGSFQETERGPVLETLLGPYPDGEVNH